MSEISFIQIKNTNLIIPEITIATKKIDKTTCKRIYISEQKINVDVYISEDSELYLLKTNAKLPFKTFYLRKYKSKKNIEGFFCLKSKKEYSIHTLDESLELIWINTNIASQNYLPEDITKSWNNKFHFLESNENLNSFGLRKPQLGALHAIASYFSLKKNTEPATIVLPTGTGKTETMLSALIYNKFKTVLLILPYKALRDQTANKFYTFGCLVDIGVVSEDILFPFVSVIKGGISSIHDAELILKNSNVIISTVDSINSSNKDAVNFLCNHTDVLFVDEAQHISANTWSSIKNKFKNKKILQFTATPFRTDGKNLDGQIIYNYTVEEAQESGYFKHIDLIPVEEYFQNNIDQAIAQSAITKLKADIDKKLNHIIMARVESISRAQAILPIYQELAAQFNPIIIHSKMNQSEINQCIYNLKEGKSRIIICVKMLGEGFDLPSLKIAALHDPHKSLAITLQFIGRFIRTSNNNSIGDASVIVNIADQQVSKELQELYSQGAEWDIILRRLTNEKIEKEIKLQDIINKLKSKGSLYKHISLWNLKPTFSAMLFSTQAQSWNPELYKEILSKDTISWHSYSEEENILIALAIEESPVKWGNYRELFDNINQLLIMKFDKQRKALFIYSNDYNFFKVHKLSKIVCGEDCQLFSGRRIFNIFTNGINYPFVINLGTAQSGAISFTQYFGPNVTEGLSKIEKARSSLINLSGVGYENGDKVLIGCSQKKGKIWSVSGGKINDWVQWVQNSWDKIINGNINNDTEENDIIKDFLWPERIKTNHNVHAFSILWGEYIQETFEEKVSIIFDNISIPLYLVEINIFDTTKLNNTYKILLKTETIESVYAFSIEEGLTDGYQYVHISGPKIKIKKLVNEYELEEYFKQDPPIIQYVDGSYSYNCYLIKTNETIGNYDINSINTINWNGINIKKESMGQNYEKDSIQWKIYESRLKNENFDIVINDDGPGEIADLLGIKSLNDKIHLTLIHCKYSSDVTPGARIKDIDIVCGQAQKAVKWKHTGMRHIYEHIKHRENLWEQNHKTRFLQGNIKELEAIKTRAYTVKLEMNTIIVQPGLKKRLASEEILNLLGCTSLYLKKTANSDLEIISSE